MTTRLSAGCFPGKGGEGDGGAPHERIEREDEPAATAIEQCPCDATCPNGHTEHTEGPCLASVGNLPHVGDSDTEQPKRE